MVFLQKISNSNFSVFNDKFIKPLNVQRQKILLVASAILVAFGSFCLLIYRYSFHAKIKEASKISQFAKNSESTKKKEEPSGISTSSKKSPEADKNQEFPSTTPQLDKARNSTKNEETLSLTHEFEKIPKIAKKEAVVEKRPNYFDSGLLPIELTLSIFQNLPTNDLRSVANTPGLKDKLTDDLWKKLYNEEFEESPKYSVWEATAMFMTPTEEVPKDELLTKVNNFIDQLKRNEFDNNTKMTLLNLLEKAFRSKDATFFPLLSEACKLYDQYLQQNPQSGLDPSPTFKEVYQIASNLKVTKYRDRGFNYSNQKLAIEVPIKGPFFLLKDVKAAVIDKFIEEGIISASEKEIAKKKIRILVSGSPIHAVNMNENYKLAGTFMIIYEKASKH
jgi:hypothetical protein